MLERLKLALDRVESHQWQAFQTFATCFLASEFPALRPVASEGGDGGTDAILLTGDAIDVVVQLSIKKRWKDKILQTAQRLRVTHPSTKLLVYATNLSIQRLVRPLREQLRRDFGIGLDVRDRDWFIQDIDASNQTATAAERFAQTVVDPLMKDLRTPRQTTGLQTLTSVETRSACVYLALQLEDDTRDKGLTKLCFDGFVRAALRGSDPDHRVARDVVREWVRAILATHGAKEVDDLTDAALQRLTKKAIRHYEKPNEYCLSYAERERLDERLISLESRAGDYTIALEGAVEYVAAALGVTLADVSLVANKVARIIERVLLRRGQEFVSMIKEDRPFAEPTRDVEDAVTVDLGQYPWEIGTIDGGTACALLTASAVDVLRTPPPAVQGHLRTLVDAYVLMAFVRETADVQSAVVKLFSSGQLWLDTSILLPVIAESLLTGDIHGQYSPLLKAATEAGLELRVTRGVVEEIERHMNLALTYAESAYAEPWRGRVPFLIAAFIDSGRAAGSFRHWLEVFRGDISPEEDLADYLASELGVRVGSLEEDLREASSDERAATQEYWVHVHEARHLDRGDPIEPIAIRRLAEHDVESWLGVLCRRRREATSPLGAKTWWMTFDKQAIPAARSIAEAMGRRKPDSPIMTPDFLLNYLSIGPCRRALSRGTSARLPLVITEAAGLELVPQELLERAAVIREELTDLPEEVVRRRVRDGLHKLRLREGQLARGGFRKADDDVRAMLRAQRNDSKADS